MGTEKQGSKSGSFLQLFDWNRKSRKKLFPNSSDFTEGSKQGKKSSSNFPVTLPHLVDEDDIGRSSVKGSSDYSCSSSVTDEEGNGIKAPGVVARLMGLDSLPTSSVPEPFSTPYFDTISLRDAQYKRTPDLLYERQYMYSDKQPTKLEGFSRNSAELRPQKMPHMPIERFQIEVLPPRSAKSISITHNKLFSPIKSPGYIPTKNAAQIMEEAAKMIEPGPHASSKSKMPLVGSSSSVPIKFRDLTNKLEAVQRSSRLPETSQRPVDSKSIKHLKGQSLNKSWNGEEASQYRNYPSEESESSSVVNKGKSISLAVQAKVNVQKRGGLSSSTSVGLQGKREHKELKSNQPFKSQSNSQKNIQKKPSASSVSGVLRQNNQKQNCSTGREKIASKSVVPNQQGRRAVQLETSFSQNKTSNKVVGNSKVGQKKSSLVTSESEKVPLSRAKTFPRKKRNVEGGLFHERSGFGDTDVRNSDVKPGQPNVAIEGHSKWMDDSRRKGMDVVSFTFTSPMKKTVPGSKSSGQVVEKHSSYSVGSSYENTPTDRNRNKLSSLGLNVIGGDALNMLLEQKLRELTYGIESPSFNSVTPMNGDTSTSDQSGLTSDFSSVRVTSTECDNRSHIGPHRDNRGSNCFSTDGHMSQEVDEMGEHSIDSGKARKELRHPSPVSILEPCFSIESCNSSDSLDTQSFSESMQCSSTESQVVISSSKVEADTELSDSASSTCSGDFGTGNKPELEYVRNVINNADIQFKDIALGRADEMVSPQLFAQLENTTKSQSRINSERRRVLFDCVSECLDLRLQPYASTGCRNWVKGEAMTRQRGWLGEEIYREISALQSTGDWILDDLVDKDMSSRNGKWLDFEIEGFELGEEIGNKILSSLVDEMVADILL
ncbi:hypothetical protein ACHQM5_026341 [Ranunculus cassubicifolius]